MPAYERNYSENKFVSLTINSIVSCVLKNIFTVFLTFYLACDNRRCI